MGSLVRPLVRPLVNRLAQLADGLPPAPVLTILTREADETVTVETLAATWTAALTREPDGTVTISEAA